MIFSHPTSPLPPLFSTQKANTTAARVDFKRCRFGARSSARCTLAVKDFTNTGMCISFCGTRDTRRPLRACAGICKAHDLTQTTRMPRPKGVEKRCVFAFACVCSLRDDAPLTMPPTKPTNKGKRGNEQQPHSRGHWWERRGAGGQPGSMCVGTLVSFRGRPNLLEAHTFPPPPSPTTHSGPRHYRHGRHVHHHHHHHHDHQHHHPYPDRRGHGLSCPARCVPHALAWRRQGPPRRPPLHVGRRRGLGGRRAAARARRRMNGMAR